MRNMREPFDAMNAMSSGAGVTMSPSRRRIMLLAAAAWTVFVCLALWFILRGSSVSSVWIVHEADSAQPSMAERFHAFFRADLGLQRIYPWILLSPYVCLLVAYFLLERGRLRLNLPLNLVACAAFIVASYAIDAFTSVTR